MNKTLLALLLLAGAAALPRTAFAGAGATGFDFLSLDGSARAVALGGAYTALAADAGALRYNPGGLGRVSQYEAGFMHDQHFGGVTQEHAGLVTPWGLGASLDYAASGQESRRTICNPDGGGLGSAGLTGLAVAAGFGTSLGKALAVGVSAKAARETIDTASARAVAFGAGVLVTPPAVPGLSLGAALLDAGGRSSRFDMAGDKLPSSARLGGAYSFSALRQRLTFALDAIKPREDSLLISGGGELLVEKALALRAGYNTGAGAGPGVAAGFGLFIDGFEIDYAVSPYGELGSSHRVSVTARWGGEKALARAQEPVSGEASAARPRVRPPAPRDPAALTLP